MNMDAFQTAFASTIIHEGSFSNDTDDPGGMTFMGISRENYPDWTGWAMIDYMIEQDPHPVFDHNEDLKDMVRIFYINEFWQRLQCDFVAGQSVDVAVELFDTAVNLGHHRAVEMLQDALNLLNQNEQDYLDIVVDGVIGQQTRAALVGYLEMNHDAVVLVRVMNCLQAGHYISLMKKYPVLEKYRGWFARV